MTNEYRSHSETPEATRRRLTAEAWRFDAEMERVAALKRRHPEVYDRLPATSHMSLGLYQNGKAAAREHDLDTTGRAGPRLDTTEGDR